MSDGQHLQVLEDGWKAYSADPPRWNDLKKVLHPQIVWHEVNSDAMPGDYEGIDDVMEHFEDCRANYYGVPDDRQYHVLKHDHAIVTDQVFKEVVMGEAKARVNEDHRCTDIYRFEDGLIREMWTCVTHPVHEGHVIDPGPTTAALSPQADGA
jgi:hypothetical protein